MVDSAWFFSGVKKGDVTLTSATATVDRPQPAREEVPAIFATDPGAKATPLVASLDINAAYATLVGMLKEIERDYPELQMDIWSAGANTSGRALRTARQRSETKVRQHRPNYDDAIVRAHQMAIAIGGWREYEPFKGYGLESYEAGKLDHSVEDRDVFTEDEMDVMETKKAFWEAVGAATQAGVTLEVALSQMGWTDEEIQEIYVGLPEQ